MNMKLQGLSLAALLATPLLVAPAVPAWAEGPAWDDVPSSEEEVGSTVGDLPGFDDVPSTFVGDAGANDAGANDAGANAGPWSETLPEHPPTSYSDLYPQSVTSHVAGGSGWGRGASCGLGCDSGCDGDCGPAGRLFGGGEDRWASAELLLWFPQQRRTPALVSTAPEGVQPVPGQPGMDIAFGGDVGDDLTPGFRLDAGRYLTENFGIGGRFWMLDEDREHFSMSGRGTGTSIGRPFFNTDQPGPDAILVNLDGEFAGSVAFESELRMLAAEAYGRLKFGRGANYRVDLIGGYTHFNIDDRLLASSTTVDTDSGTRSTFFDDFDAENQFHGGQLGFETTVSKGRWALTSLSKVHFGNMNQSIAIDGASRRVTAADPPTTERFDAGALALDAQGQFERDEFAFAPELNLKLAYQFRRNVQLSVGYSFMYFDNVLLAGDHVDPLFDGTTILTDGPHGQRDFEFDDSSLWVQGIDLGFVLDF